MLAIAIIFAHSRRISSSSSSCPATTALPDHVHDLHDPETDVDALVIDYVDDNASSFSKELPDDGSQKPDDTTDD